MNHLRPPSLVPITIQQATNSNYNSNAATTNNGQQQSAAAATIASQESSTNLRPQLMVNSGNNNNNGTQIAKGPAGSNQHQLRGRHQRASGQGVGESERLVQLQLPLQLHLKLRPLPLPMPPPSSNRRSSISFIMNEEAKSDDRQTNTGGDDDDSFASGEKRKRSLEFDTTATAAPTAISSSPSPAVANKTSVKVRDNESASLERNDLLMFAWREAKRVLLLNSMSPALLQAGKLERRIADLRGSETSVESSSGVRAKPEVPSTPTSRPDVQESNLKNVATNFLNKESSGQNLVMEQQNNMATTSAAILGANINDNENSLTKDKEVRRQRHSSQQVSLAFLRSIYI